MSSATTEVDIWERIIRPQGEMPKETARRIAGLSLMDEDHARMRELAERNRRGELSEDEEAELDHLCRVGTLLSILKLRARRVLQSDNASR